MAEPQPVEPVKLIVALLWSEAAARERSLKRLGQEWGEADFIGEDHPFDATHYYEAEMGFGLRRRLLSFARLVQPESVRAAKLICNRIEDELASDRRRRGHLDEGYLGDHK